MTPSDPSGRRLHPLSILFGFAAAARSFALPAIFFLATAGFAGFAWQLMMLPLAVPYLFLSVARYISFRYRYDPGEMVIRSGLLFRNERHIPYARIQNIDCRQNLAHRLLGVVEVRVETGGGQEAEATMSVLPLADFEEMRRRVFGRNDADAETPAAPVERTLLHLSPRELLIHGFIQNRGFVVIAAGLGLLWELGPLNDFLGFLSDGKMPGRDAVRGLFDLPFDTGWLALKGIGLTVVALLALLVAVRLISMVWAVIRLHDFRLARAGEDLRIEHGLLTRMIATVPLRRIQTLTVLEGPLHRLFGRAAMKVDTAGGHAGSTAEDGESPARREWLAPIFRLAELSGLVREVLPGVDLEAVEWRPAPPRAFVRELKSWILIALVVTIPLTLFLKGWALAVLPFLLAWAYAGARGTIARLGWAVTKDAVLFRSGWLWRQVSAAPFAKIQAVTIHESPFDRRAAMARVRVDTAGAGEWSHRVDIPYLPREMARELFALLEARATQTELSW
jgi:putative membrane protein